MQTVKVSIDIPDGWELADKKMRSPKPGEWYLAADGSMKIKRGVFTDLKQVRVILKRVEANAS